MKKIARYVFAALTALLTAGAVLLLSLHVFADDQGDTAADPSKIEKLIVDFRSAEAFAKNAGVYNKASELSGSYSFDIDRQAMRIGYAPGTDLAPYRFTMRITNSAIATDGYRYMVVVYSAKTDSPYRLSVWNSAKQGVEAVIAEEGSDTDGKWVISAPIDITAVKNGNSLLACFLSANTVSIAANDTEAEFYMKEIGFFKTAADAELYYSAVDMEKAPSEYGDVGASYDTTSTPPAEQPTSGNASHHGVAFITVPDDEEDSTDEAELPEPVIMDFSSSSTLGKNAYIAFLAGDLEGKYEFVKLSDGTECMRLIYSPGQGHQAYRIMPALGSAGLTSEHKYIRITFMTNDKTPPKITVSNNATSGSITLVEGVAYPAGEFVRSNAVRIDDKGILDRFVNRIHCNFEYHSSDPNSLFYIKEIAFFASADQAYEYYGDEAAETYVAMTFDEAGNGIVNREGSDFGISEYNSETGALDITYAPVTNRTVNYMAKIKFNKVMPNLLQYSYVRVLYAADHPDGIETASMFLRNDRLGEECVRLAADIKDTNGEFVLSETVRLTEDMVSRFAGRIHNSLTVNPTGKDGTYSIKAIYFFPTRKMAEDFTVVESEHTIEINGNDITKYRIVISEDATESIKTYAFLIAERIKKLTDLEIETVTDKTPVSEYEILIGPSSRPLSTVKNDELNKLESGYKNYYISLEGNTLVISAVITPAVEYAADRFLKDSLYGDVALVPDVVVIDDRDCFTAEQTTIGIYSAWEEGTPVAAPTVFTEDFDTDDGYFNEENGEDNWHYENGVYKADADSFALSYIHVYEKNAVFGVKMRYTHENGGSMGLMLRCNSEDAYVKAGYDFAEKVWFIESRDGRDFFVERLASVSASVADGVWYELSLTVDGTSAVFSVNGEVVLTTDEVGHLSPGRVAVYADNASVCVDDALLTLTSGQGTILRNVSHTKLPDETYREGGSVTEMKDGSLTYLHHSNATFKSLDNGKTWTRTDVWTSSYGYVSIFRLNNGDLMKIGCKSIDGVSMMISLTSSDDGKTWTEGGAICEEYYKGSAARAGNMNDKLTQSASTGRIFYVQTYESTSEAVDGKYIFCLFFYSDDNGKTWTASETDSWGIEGLENAKYFSECKIIECADGSLRLYNSWNMSFDCIVYSESYDNGVTWGPIQKIPELQCPVSSMQIVRDTYADNDTTYYMVWVNAVGNAVNSHTPRSRLSLAKTVDGKNWEYIGDIWRWESSYYFGSLLNIVVDPFIKVTEDYIICGSGFSDGMQLYGESGAPGHMSQRQHIYSIKKDTLPEGKPINKFVDVTHGAPYYEAVSYVNAKELFQGTSENTFSPDVIMNRSMFVTVLGRLDGVDTADYTGVSFSDVDTVNGSWYAPFVEWAAKNSIVQGMDDGTFGVNGSITVEQACLILYRYANKSADTETGITLTDFADPETVDGWAKEGVEWALANGIYTGQNGRLNANSPASRATVATMFYNYVKVFVQDK